MGIKSLSNAELLARIAGHWLRERVDPALAATVPQRLRELLDETVRRMSVDRDSTAAASDTPTETPASRKRHSQT
jgi:hypothetical protein